MAIINEEKIKKLETVLTNYPDILSEFGIKKQIIKTFKFEKPLASLELYDKNTQKVAQFIEDLESFFFVGNTYFESESQEVGFSGLIFISRFKNVFDVAINYPKKLKSLLDEFADLSGILFGKSPKEVAQYCSEQFSNDKMSKILFVDISYIFNNIRFIYDEVIFSGPS